MILEDRLLEAPPRMIHVGYLYQNRLRRPASRVPFIRLAGQWLAAAGFNEGDSLTVQVTSGEIRLIKQESAAASNPRPTRFEQVLEVG